MAAKSEKTEQKQNKRGTNPNSLANLRPRNGKNGRKQIPEEFKALLKENTVKALATVLEIMESGKDSERLKAAELVLDRAYGKAVQPIDADVNGNVKVEVLLPPGLDDLAG